MTKQIKSTKLANEMKMKHSKCYLKSTCLALVMIMTILIPFTACEPGVEPIIENQTDRDVSIYITDVLSDGTLGEQIDYGVVLAHSTKQIASIVFIKPEWVYRIQAINPSGEVVFSHDYNYYDLEEISWKITIPP